MTIQRIFALDTVGLVREAWAVDAQTHGDAAALNAEAMEDPDLKYCKCVVEQRALPVLIGNSREGLR